MATEIERKFLVTDQSFKQMARSSVEIIQGYLSTDARATVRVRIKGDRGYITVKGLTSGCRRSEWEYEIDSADAREMAGLCRDRIIEKRRWLVDYEGYTWEVDEFFGRHAGLIIAEVEMQSENERPALPPFVGEEVTGDPRYYNSTLCGQRRDSCSSR